MGYMGIYPKPYSIYLRGTIYSTTCGLVQEIIPDARQRAEARTRAFTYCCLLGIAGVNAGTIKGYINMYAKGLGFKV